jgi:hypothetical protein
VVTAKNPGAGRGKGGGRPKRDEVEEMRLRLSPPAAALLKAHAEAAKLPVWRVVDDLVMVALGGQAPPAPLPPLPPLALEVARNVAAFLARHEGKAEAPQALRMAWARTVLTASKELKQGG